MSDQNEPAPLWPLAIALVIIAIAVIALVDATSTANSILWGVLLNAAIIAMVAIWFGYGVALMVRGVMTSDGGATFTGAVVVASSIAAPYILLVSGVVKLLSK